jgi:hypothetical protein
MRRLVIAVGLLGTMLSTVKPAAAESITYTESFTGSGVLGGREFTNATVVLAGTADTTDIDEVDSTLYINSHVAMSAAIGLETVSFTDSFNVFVNQAPFMQLPAFGFQDNDVEQEFASANSSAFGSYNLDGPLSPVAAIGPGIDTLDTYGTSGGSLKFSSASGPLTVAAFSAGAVPEPSSFVLAAIGVAAVTGYQLRRRKLARA